MRAGLLERQLGAADPAVYHELVDALAPQRHWRFDEASGTSALDRIAGHTATLANGPRLGVDPLVRNAAGGQSIGLKGGATPAHVTIADLVTSPAFTLDVALQVDQHPGAAGKYLIATTGGGSTPGEVSLELEDDGAFGLWVRCWSVDDGGTPIIRRTDPRAVPIGRAFKLAYRRHGDGTQSVLIDGVAQALSAESGSDPGGWSAVPSTTWYIGVWPSLAGPFKGLIAELVAWPSVVADAALRSLARTRDVVWLGDFDAGSANQNSTRTIDTTPYAFPTTGLIAVRDTDGSLGTVASNGAAFDYLAGASDGADSFTGHVERAGSSSRIATIGVTVAAGQVKDGTPTDDAVPAGFVNPIADHAATGDGTADDTAELQAALGGSSNVWMASGEDYRITGTVTTGSQDVVSYGARVLYDRSQNDGAAVRIGSGQTEGRYIHGLRVINQNQSDWSNDGSIGLDLLEIADTIVRVVPEVSGFTTGIALRSINQDEIKCAYNGVLGLGLIKNNKRGLWQFETDALFGGNPWTNGNYFVGGRIVVDAAVNNAQDRFGVTQESFADGTIDGTNYLMQGFELAEDGAGTAVLYHQIGWSHGLVYYSSADSGGETIQIDAGIKGHGMWASILGADTAAPVTLTQIGSTFGEQFAVDHRRILNGGAANNLEDLGGVID